METGTFHKRRRLNIPAVKAQEARVSSQLRLVDPSSKLTAGNIEEDNEALPTAQEGLISLHRSISPPISKGNHNSEAAISLSIGDAAASENSKSHTSTTIPSPIRLTRICDLDASKNVDTIGLDDILGDPLIKECWQFNYLFDVDFLM